MKQQLQQELALGLQKLSLSMSDAFQLKLTRFLQLLHKWNQHINLTAITNYPEMLTKHVLDSLSVARFINGHTILDVGTGAGFPGVPLACCYPGKQFVLLDSNGKKTAFLQHAKVALKLDNIRIEKQRLEKFSLNDGFDVIISRAVGLTNVNIEQMMKLLKPSGKILLMKGHLSEKDLQSLSFPYQVESLEIPGLAAKRHLITIKGV